MVLSLAVVDGNNSALNKAKNSLKKFLHSFTVCYIISLAVTWHTMKPQMAGETNWELRRRMSDSKKPGDKSLYIIHVDVLCVFVSWPRCITYGLFIWQNMKHPAVCTGIACCASKL